MNERDKALNFLGLCQRAGKLVSGDEQVEQATKFGQVYVLLCASDASESAKKRYQNLSENYDIPLYTQFTREELSNAIGKARTMLGIQDRGMAKNFMSYEDGEETMN